MMQTAARLRRRAWQGYLEATRDDASYRQAEPEAWARLQARLADIDEELEQALSS
jgi:hypothetical protein